MDKEQLLIDFGQKVQQYRIKKKYTQLELAEKANISNNHMGRIERGETNTVITNLFILAEILDIPDSLLAEMKKKVRDLNEEQ
ncbi:helix-turn-helix domain-containing protein [Virgibacillus litoralis]|uniref:Transcriptional regulator with XRE-family HTH domain n=1 Tax=Virgibacillus litoralis TaxID=578221 RepID=A0ABS4HEN1_9BACI|nr:transcriptional regulator with XRE-family HTH domain [Virgibacillus litoralis]